MLVIISKEDKMAAKKGKIPDLREDSLKRGVATKQCAAACNPSYRENVLKKLF